MNEPDDDFDCESNPEDLDDGFDPDSAYEAREELRMERLGLIEPFECPGPDEGDAESGPPAVVHPCCSKHFPHFDFGNDGPDFGDDDIPF